MKLEFTFVLLNALTFAIEETRRKGNLSLQTMMLEEVENFLSLILGLFQRKPAWYPITTVCHQQEATVSYIAAATLLNGVQCVHIPMDEEHDADGARFEEFLGLKHSLGQMKWTLRSDFQYLGRDSAEQEAGFHQK